MLGRLNAFQLSMLEWNDLHPYNAVHVVRIPERLDVERLRTIIRRTLEGKGLTGLKVDRRAGTYEYHGGPADAGLKIAGGSAPTSIGFTEELEHQLNTPFSYSGQFTPFRCLAFPKADAFSLGLVYFHPIADAESIVFLLKDMVDAYRGTSEPQSGDSFERYPGRRDNLLRSHPLALARKLASLPSSVRSMRLACRPNYRDFGDGQNKLTMFSLTESVLGRMVETAKALKVTLNDLFLAMLTKAVSLLAPDRAHSARRKNLAIGCIVNTRRDLRLDGPSKFGLFLGSFVVHHAAPAGIGVADLARDIGRQTGSIKQKQLYLGAALELSFGRLMVSLFSERRRRKLYQKHYPLWGGLTNMNLNTLWPQPDETRRLDYFRAVCTGPVTPLVASITTVGRAANVSLTYRSTVFGAAEIERVKACFLDPVGSPDPA
jgi:hypothetical protein